MARLHPLAHSVQPGSEASHSLQLESPIIDGVQRRGRPEHQCEIDLTVAVHVGSDDILGAVGRRGEFAVLQLAGMARELAHDLEALVAPDLGNGVNS